MGHQKLFHPSRNLEIKKSTIPEAGLGVIATKFIPKKTVLGYYKGVVLNEREYKRLEDKSYVFEVDLKDRTIYIDAQDPDKSNWTRYINGARTKKERKLINIETFQQGATIYFEAIRDIYPGDELLYSYGRHYW